MPAQFLTAEVCKLCIPKTSVGAQNAYHQETIYISDPQTKLLAILLGCSPWLKKYIEENFNGSIVLTYLWHPVQQYLLFDAPLAETTPPLVHILPSCSSKEQSYIAMGQTTDLFSTNCAKMVEQPDSTIFLCHRFCWLAAPS